VSECCESLIAIDRVLFILERLGEAALVEVRVVPAFDPRLSPRNLVILAKKK